jgi:23S rRNA (uracil1939-C5)-methyltransferase
MNLHKDDIFEVSVHDLGVHGEGIGHLDGVVIFVQGLLPGEVGRVQITEVKKNYLKGALLEIVKSSPKRVKPICPVFGKCGGCQIMHLDYEEQLVWKRRRIVEAIRRIGKVENPEVALTAPSPKKLHYRNKMQLPVKGVEIGLYEHGTHNIVPIEECFIQDEKGELVFQEIKKIIEKEKPKLRHILIRTANGTNDVLVMLITEEKITPHIKQIASEINGVVGVIHGENRGRANIVLPEKVQKIIGKERMKEHILGLSFQVSLQSFLQVNIPQAEAIYQKAYELSELKSGDAATDLYAGIGIFACFLASKGIKMHAIECIPDAVEDIKRNAKQNEVKVDALCGMVEDLLHHVKKSDVFFLNPPRKGCEESVLKVVAEMNPKKIIYTSCNPETLARDVAYLREKGYRSVSFYPFDLFPQTTHVETLALLLKTEV